MWRSIYVFSSFNRTRYLSGIYYNKPNAYNPLSHTYKYIAHTHWWSHTYTGGNEIKSPRFQLYFVDFDWKSWPLFVWYNNTPKYSMNIILFINLYSCSIIISRLHLIYRYSLVVIESNLQRTAVVDKFPHTLALPSVIYYSHQVHYLRVQWCNYEGRIWVSYPPFSFYFFKDWHTTFINLCTCLTL